MSQWGGGRDRKDKIIRRMKNPNTVKIKVTINLGSAEKQTRLTNKTSTAAGCAPGVVSTTIAARSAATSHKWLTHGLRRGRIVL